MIFTIFKKELKETLRDRRTVMTMIIVPTLIFPVIMNVFMGVTKKFEKEAAEKALNIGLVSDKNNALAKELSDLPISLGKKKMLTFSDTTKIIQAVKSDSIQLGIYIPANMEELRMKMQPIPVKLFYDGTDLGMQDRGEAYINFIQDKWKKERYAALAIDEQKITPIDLQFSNIASSKEMVGKLIGGILPYLFIIFGFMACMYPAIDLFTGEKERGTIETLLSTPVPRWKILFGKMGVVVLSGVIAATASLFGIYLSFEFFGGKENAELMLIVKDILSFKFILMLFLLLFPLIIFFAGIMIPMAIRSKSFKEAQSKISPLNMIIIMPALIGFLPGIELNYWTALIPIVNIVLATKELIAGTLEWHLVALAFTIMIAIAYLAVLFSYRKFGNETNVVN